MSTLEKVSEEVKALKPEELQRVRQLVDSLLDEQSRPVSEDEVEKRLAAQGVITLPSGPPVAATARPQPIPVTGKPLSETFIEERR